MLNEAQTEQVAFENERRQKNGYNRAFLTVKGDIIPDWYEEEKQMRNEEKDQKKEKMMQAEVEMLMQEYLEREGS